MGNSAGFWVAILVGLSLGSSHAAADGEVEPANERRSVLSEEREPCDRYEPNRQPLFGDVHVHTGFSQDASTQGTRNTPRDAYGFALGKRVDLQPYTADGRALRSLQIDRPLDFAAVTDHAEMLGEVKICETPGLVGHDSLPCRIYRRWPRLAFLLMNARSSNADEPRRYGFCGPAGENCARAARSQWREIQAAAEEAYDRTAACTFTSFVAYEYTGSPMARNIHRNVIYRNATVPGLPISYYEAPKPETLWRRLAETCTQTATGCDVLAIPHNSNLSDGLMFAFRAEDGSAPTKADAQARVAMEPLVEIMQHKGDSECLPGVGTEDELCAFEALPYNSFGEKFTSFMKTEPNPRNFVRNVLQEGLRFEEELGANPFKLGIIASTDTHLGTPGAVSERRHPGHGGAGTPALREMPPGLSDDLDFNPGGLMVAWAEENARDSIFDAMRRREVYGTSGTRPLLRFFGGWDYPDSLCQRSDFAAAGYAGGVPMGGDLRRRPSDDATPTFAVWALRDPGTATQESVGLQRVQVIKGWLDGDVLREQVYDVAGDANNGASVDPRTCAPTGVGSDSLCAVWQDPDFDSTQRAFYYVRVLENPTCRWSAWACLERGVDCRDPASVPADLDVCCDPRHRKTIQERAWSSPIWYSPVHPTS